MNDITGQKFYRLTAIRFVYRKGTSYYWEFLCECGVKKVIRKNCVINNPSQPTKSCGCVNREWRVLGNSNRKHGLSNTRFNNIFLGIKKRCNNPKAANYEHYGERGIKCLWKSFEGFRDDMYESYLEHVKEFGEKETTIDRIDNDGNYCKGNCRWATWKEQQQN